MSTSRFFLLIVLAVVATMVMAVPAMAQDSSVQWWCQGVSVTENSDGTFNVTASGYGDWWRIVSAGGLVVSGPQGSKSFDNMTLADGQYQVQAADYESGPWTTNGCWFTIENPPPPNENWAQAAVDYTCEGDASYAVITITTSEGALSVEPASPYTVLLTDAEQQIVFTVAFPDGEPNPYELGVVIPTAENCGENPPPPPVTENHEFPFPCISPDGLDNRVHAMQWVYIVDGEVEMAGSLIYFQSKEGTLTSNNAKAGDTFKFWTFPADYTLERAQAEGVGSAVFVGVSTVNSWLAGVEHGSCSPQVAEEQSVSDTCEDCPPTVCLLQPGSYVQVANHWVGLEEDGTVSIFETEPFAPTFRLRYAGYECALCAVHTVNGVNQTVYVTTGSTAYDIAVAIQLVERIPEVPHFTQAQFASAQLALENWHEAGRVSGWYSYR